MMETANQTRTAIEREAYRRRFQQPLPDAFAEAVPAPGTWPHSQAEWDLLADEARRCHALRPSYDFAFAIAVLGYYPEELASGTLNSGAKIAAMTGRVVRPPAPELSPELAEACGHVLAEAAKLLVTLDGVIQQTLEHAGWYRRGDERDVRRKLIAAQSVVSEHRAVLQANRERKAAMPVLTVRRPFRAKGGRRYSPGRFKVSAEEAAELAMWQEEMEAMAQAHEWDATSGFTRETWPPFEIEEAQRADQKPA